MKSKHKFFIFVAAVLICLTISSLSYSDTIPLKPSGYVVDLAGIIDNATESKLTSFLSELEQKTTAQLVILTIKSLEGASLEEFSIEIAHNKWKLGQKDKDNGVLFLIAMAEKKYRVEVGYGLEGILPDSRVGSIGRDFLVPFFKNGEFSKGVYTATLVMANDIASDAGVTISGMPSVQNVPNRKPPSLASKIISFIVIIILLIFFIKNPKLFMLFLLFSAMGGRGGSWSGGRGGFGGGGGGGFGGGGSSGGW